jgi:hypothetical protein
MNEVVKQFADDALAIQDASNASGVVHCMVRSFSKLENEKIAWENFPPLILFSDKLDDLCRCRKMLVLPLTGTIHDIGELMAEFKRVMDAVNAQGGDTDVKNTHVKLQECVLQLVYFTGSRSWDRLSDAMDACESMKMTGDNLTVTCRT